MGEHVSDVDEWEWRVEDPANHAHLGSREIHGLYARGRLWAVIVLTDESDGPTRWHFTAPDEEDAWVGYEGIDSFDTLEAAKASIDAERDETLKYLRESED